MGSNEGRELDGWRFLLPLVLLGLAAGLGAFFPSYDPDTYFHLAIGRDIANLGRVPGTETLSFWSEGSPFVNHEWLYDLVVWKAYDLGGWWGVGLLRAVLAGGLFFTSGLFAVRMGASPWLALGMGLLFIPLVRYSLDLRPHVAGYLLAAVQLVLTAPGRRATAFRIGLISVNACLWANTHGSFPLAIVLWALWVLAPVVEGDARGERTRRLAAGPFLALALMANPWGPTILATIFFHIEPRFAHLIPEWRAGAWGDDPARDGLFLLLLGATLASFVTRANRRMVVSLAMCLAFLIPAVKAAKFEIGLVAGVFPFLAANITRIFRMSRTAVGLTTAASVVVASALSLAIFPGSRFGPGFDREQVPEDALSFAESRGIQGRLFHPFDQGGYVGFRSHPRLRPILDGRAYVHGMDRIDTFLASLADYRVFRRQAVSWDLDAVMVDFLDPAFPRLTEGLGADPDFELVYLDSRFALFVPAARRGTGLEPFRVLRASPDPRYLFDLDDGELESARGEIARVGKTVAGRDLSLLLNGVSALSRAGLGWEPPNAAGPAQHPEACQGAVRDLGELAGHRPEIPMFRYFQAIAEACNGNEASALAIADTTARDFPLAGILAGALRERMGVKEAVAK